MVLVLFAYLEMDRDPAFAKVLFWIGAPVSLFLSIVWVGECFVNRPISRIRAKGD